jgi:hypothetical protein
LDGKDNLAERFY